MILASSNLASKIISDHASPAQKQRRYAEGALGPASFALSEAGCGSDAAALTTVARPIDGGFSLDEQRANAFLTFADVDARARSPS